MSPTANRRRWWPPHRTLASLAGNLRYLGVPLVLRRGPSFPHPAAGRAVCPRINETEAGGPLLELPLPHARHAFR